MYTKISSPSKTETSLFTRLPLTLISFFLNVLHKRLYDKLGILSNKNLFNFFPSYFLLTTNFFIDILYFIKIKKTIDRKTNKMYNIERKRITKS